jgi:hypothetical protein
VVAVILHLACGGGKARAQLDFRKKRVHLRSIFTPYHCRNAISKGQNSWQSSPHPALHPSRFFVQDANCRHFCIFLSKRRRASLPLCRGCGATATHMPEGIAALLAPAGAITHWDHSDSGDVRKAERKKEIRSSSTLS